jgi:hypothetical protein
MSSPGTACQILDERYARGEIDEQDYAGAATSCMTSAPVIGPRRARAQHRDSPRQTI